MPLFISIYKANQGEQPLFPAILPNYNNHINTAIWTIIFFVAIFLFQGVLLLEPLKRWRRYFRKKRIEKEGYGYALKLMQGTFASINIHKMNKDTNLKAEEAKILLTKMLDCIQKIYQHKTGKKCSVSLKLIEKMGLELSYNSEVIHLLRDSIAKNEKKRDSKGYMDYTHLISSNTCFEEITKNYLQKRTDELYYINEDLPSDFKYKNSTIDMLESYVNFQFSKKAQKDISKRRSEWPLPYRSEIVVPLLPSVEHEQNWILFGFLCLDCEMEKNTIFDKDYDVPLLRGCVDGIYDLIYQNIEHLFQIIENDKKNS